MSDASGGDLQFETAEVDEGHADPTACGSCGGSLAPSYWVVDGQPACARCKGLHAARGTGGTGPGRFARACLFGGLAGAVGAGIWYGIREVSGYEIGLISIVVGWMVGAGVRIGSRERGGRLYQALAVFIAYTAIVSTYVPLIVRELRSQDLAQAESATSGEGAGESTSTGGATPAPASGEGAAPPPTGGLPAEEEVTAAQALVAFALFAIFIAAIAYAAPFLVGFENLIGIAIIAFGLWEAWRINRRTEPAISGPFRIGAAPGGAPPPAAGIPGV